MTQGTLSDESLPATLGSRTCRTNGTARVCARASTSTLWSLVSYATPTSSCLGNTLANYLAGESGLGKSTLVNTLFNTSLYPPKEQKGPSLDIIPKTVTIQSISADIEEAGVRLRLTVVDTPGFGDFVNNDESWRPITDNIEQRFDAYLDAENKVNRVNIVDNRIHACVFFIQPTGHSLKPLDIEVMKRLHTKVNLIPVIAKSDTLTDEEIFAFKQRVSYLEYHYIMAMFVANWLADPGRYQAPQGSNLRGPSLRAR